MKLKYQLKLLLLLTFSSQLFGNISLSSGFEISLELIDVACTGDSTGSAFATIANGSPPYQFTWNTADTSNHIEHLSAGNYSLTVSDASGCVDSIDFIITEPDSPLEFYFNINQPNCIGYEGWVISHVSGGIPPYQYLWNNGISGSATPTFGFGNYSLTVTDANNCMVTESTDVNLECNLQAMANIVNHVSCTGGNDGVVTLSYSGCTPDNVEFCLSGGSCTNNSTFSGLSAGTYTFLVYSSPCASSISVTIEEPSFDSLSYEIIEYSNIGCFNEYGVIEILGTGGLPPYVYDWSNNSTSNSIDSLSQGDYSITITDSIGCSVSDNFSILQLPFISAGSDDTLQVYCPFDSIIEPVEISPVFEDSSSNYIFEWTDSNGAILSSGNFSNLITDSVGTYYFFAIDTLNNCVFSDSVNVSYLNNYNAEPITSNPIIINSTNDLNNGSINPGLSGGYPPYVYIWNQTNQDSIVSNLAPGNYPLTVLDAFWCSYEFNYFIDNVTNTSNIEATELRIYPNPSTGSFTLYSDRLITKFNRLNIFDSIGNLVHQTNLSQSSVVEFELHKLENGVYLVSLESLSGEKIMHKIVINK